MGQSLGVFYADLTKKLAASGIESPEYEARCLLKHRLNIEWAEIISNPARELADKGLKDIETDVDRRLKGEPLSRIHGIKEFRGLEFVVTGDTLDPRPETELLVDHALKLFHGKHPERVIDLGTGTGCIIIALLKEWPAARGVAVDISPQALSVAKTNAIAHKVADRLEFVQSDWDEVVEGRFDLVVSNPPYIPSSDIESLQQEVRNHDPILALDGGFDGLEAYKKIFSGISGLLTPVGKGLFEIGVGQQADIERLAGKYRIRIEQIHPDYSGIPRVVEISNGDN
jgi:release factor glutamine methyltransferase